jgi:hypothetical protein
MKPIFAVSLILVAFASATMLPESEQSAGQEINPFSPVVGLELDQPAAAWAVDARGGEDAELEQKIRQLLKEYAGLEDGAERQAVRKNLSALLAPAVHSAIAATAGPVFVAGSQIAGSQITGGLIGPTPSLTDLEDGDLKVSLDFRQVYAALLEQWLQVSSREALGGAFESLAVIVAS